MAEAENVDPRDEAAARALGRIHADDPDDWATWLEPARAVRSAVDAADPLRVLLADPEAEADLIARTVHASWDGEDAVRAVLAALREVSGL